MLFENKTQEARLRSLPVLQGPSNYLIVLSRLSGFSLLKFSNWLIIFLRLIFFFFRAGVIALWVDPLQHELYNISKSKFRGRCSITRFSSRTIYFDTQTSP